MPETQLLWIDLANRLLWQAFVSVFIISSSSHFACELTGSDYFLSSFHSDKMTEMPLWHVTWGLCAAKFPFFNFFQTNAVSSPQSCTIVRHFNKLPNSALFFVLFSSGHGTHFLCNHIWRKTVGKPQAVMWNKCHKRVLYKKKVVSWSPVPQTWADGLWG